MALSCALSRSRAVVASLPVASVSVWTRITPDGIVKFSGSVADLADEPRHAERPWLSIAPRDHQPRRLAVSPRRCERARCRRSPGPTRPHGVLRSDPAVVPHGWFSRHAPAHASTGPAGRHRAPGRGLRHPPGPAALSLACRRKRAATRLFRTLLQGQARTPGRVGTDTLPSDRTAHRAVLPSVAQRTDRYAHHRADVSHQPTRHRTRHLRRVNSPGPAQRFLTVHGLVRTLFRGGRHLVRAVHQRERRRRSFLIGDAVTLAA